MMTVYLYFLCAFCSVYKASQWNWFTNGITSNVLSFLTTLGITLLITLCRFIGLVTLYIKFFFLRNQSHFRANFQKNIY